MTPESQLAFVAGYLEGEGHFRVRGNSPSIEAKSINPSILFKVQGYTGVGNITPMKDDRPKRRQCWRWVVCGVDAVGLARALMDSGEMQIKSSECRAVALCDRYKDGTPVGNYLRQRALDLRGAEYPLCEE